MSFRNFNILPKYIRYNTEKNILEDLFSSGLSQFKKHHPPGNLKVINLGIFQSLKLRYLMRKNTSNFPWGFHSKYYGLLWVKQIFLFDTRLYLISKECIKTPEKVAVLNITSLVVPKSNVSIKIFITFFRPSLFPIFENFQIVFNCVELFESKHVACIFNYIWVRH